MEIIVKSILSVKNLDAFQGSTFHLRIDSLKAKAGSVTCIVGPNGAGKTTFLECLTGMLKPLRGEIVIKGVSITNQLQPLRLHVGYIPDDEDWFIKELTAREYFEVLVSVYKDAGVTAPMTATIEQLSEQLSFTAFELPLQYLSHGNKKKVQCIAALMHNPSVVIVDEIRNGLDPLAIIAVESILQNLVKKGVCIIAATHDLWWAERIATNIILLKQGAVAVQDSLENILQQHTHLEDLFVEIMGEAAL